MAWRRLQRQSATCVECGDLHGIEQKVSCNAQACFPQMQVSTAMIEENTCGTVAGWPITFMGSRITVTLGGTACTFNGKLEAGVTTLGDWIQLMDGSLFGEFPLLGGPCRGQSAPTGAIRFIFSCPKCQFVLGF